MVIEGMNKQVRSFTLDAYMYLYSKYIYFLEYVCLWVC